jgi:quinol monooxygenase YgiN
MEGVEQRVRQQPGLLSFKTLTDVDAPNRYCVLTKWASINHLNKWMEEPWYKEKSAELDDLCLEPAKYRIYRQPEEDVFLL